MKPYPNRQSQVSYRTLLSLEQNGARWQLTLMASAGAPRTDTLETKVAAIPDMPCKSKSVSPHE